MLSCVCHVNHEHGKEQLKSKPRQASHIHLTIVYRISEQKLRTIFFEGAQY